MQSINALSLTPDINDWLANSRQPRILHIFDYACNLINERRKVLSIVTQEIGNGPFNLVIEEDILFSDHLNLESPISNSPNILNLGDLTIRTENARLWFPHPNWEILRSSRDDISKSLFTNYQQRGLDTDFAKNAQTYSTTIINHQLPITSYLSSNSPFSNSLVSALANADLSASLNATQKLAGLGIGLTPSGDDFIMGAILAAWIIHPADRAEVLAAEVTEVAAALTTSLSGAWLRSAGRGEAGILWHQFFESLLTGDSFSIQLQINKLLSIGHTSGEDAMAGFLGVYKSWAGVSRGELRPIVIR